MVNLDRFSQGRRDPAETSPLETCQACGGDIYPGEDVYVVDGYILHHDPECLLGYALESGMLGEMTIGEALEVKS